jgi:DNA-binding CsgD family transcriptional regulator
MRGRLVKPKTRRGFGFTPREIEILNALATYRSIPTAAGVLGIEGSTIRSTLYRVRERFDDASEFIREYRAWSGKMPRRRYL